MADIKQWTHHDHRRFVTQTDIANMARDLYSPFGRTISGQALSVDGDLQVLV